MVKFEAGSFSPGLIPNLLEIGFTKCDENFVRFCFTDCLERDELLSEISRLCPESISSYEGISDFVELERYCSPVSLKSTEQKYLLMPIKPGYAMSLFGRLQSAGDLFGGNFRVLLRWDNVYYRPKTLHNMIERPARILWYLSQPNSQIEAVSTLDKVKVDTPKNLFRQFKRFGILEWQDLYEMCQRDTSKEIMALRFSNTFLLRKPVPLYLMRSVFKENMSGLQLQSPSKLEPVIFQKLFHLGYSGPS